MIGLLLLALIMALAAVAFSSATRQSQYPDQLHYGRIMIEFSRIDHACYLVATVSVIVGVVAGLILVWGPDRCEWMGKILATAAIVLAGSVFVLLLNRLMRGRGAP